MSATAVQCQACLTTSPPTICGSRPYNWMRWWHIAGKALDVLVAKRSRAEKAGR